MGKVGSVGCVGFLVEGTSVCVLVDEAGLFLLLGRAMSSGVFWGVCELSMTSGRLSANGWGCVPILLVFRHGASSTGGCWPLGGAWS